VSTTGRAPTTMWVVSSLDDDGLDVAEVEVLLLEVLLELQAAARTVIVRLAAAAMDARPTRVNLMTLLITVR
jgi:hypothetical protein